MELITLQKFSNETVVFDGFYFTDCAFDNCIVVITTLRFGFERCTFTDTSFHVDPRLPIRRVEDGAPAAGM